MRLWLVCITLLAFPMAVWSQQRINISLNAAPLIVNTLDVKSEFELSKSMSLQVSTGFRAQGRKINDSAQMPALVEFIPPKHRSAFLTVGGRFFNQEIDPYQYPFIEVGLTGVYYRETILVPDQITGEPVGLEVNDFKIGGTATIGFSLQLSKRLRTDLGLQASYSPPREDALAYYLPGMGFTTYGYGILGVKGGHLQPVIALKYAIKPDKRNVIRWQR
ncbi:MAG: DUF3575 domain-containing protein [Bacteroidia bacterium]|nr:DUF3575 domain-containing protein [Bacteroidia bacterium]